MTSALQGPMGPALVRVVNGTPTPEEVAAVTVVLTALQGRQEDTPAPVPKAAGWRRAGADGAPPTSWMART